MTTAGMAPTTARRRAALCATALLATLGLAFGWVAVGPADGATAVHAVGGK